MTHHGPALLRCLLILGALGGGAASLRAADAPRPSVVAIVKDARGYHLTRNGQPYFIKGVGGETNLKALAAAGGNSIRTWGVDHAQTVLDEAQTLGLTVTLGIWLGHERHGFNYNDADQVAKQYETVRKAILKYKDHPSLLMWGLGNEMEGYDKADNAAIWSALNNLADLAKTLDPNHPTMTAMAEIGGDKVKNAHRLCPALDVIGINTYGGVASIPARYKAAGGSKPYVLTEFGPPGTWESKKNAWAVVPELTSTAKADAYRRGYEGAVLGAKGLCLGSYAFLWGHKQEATATWFGLLLPDGRRLAGADALSELWTGKPVAHPCPTITGLTVSGPDQVEPGASVRAALSAAGAKGDRIEVQWVLQREPSSFSTGGDAEEVPPTFPDAIAKSDATGAEVVMPKEGGGYRLFAYVRDTHGGAAVANVPLFVKGPSPKASAGRKVTAPLVVYDEAGRPRPAYVPSGWMGNTKALKVDEECATKPHDGKTCLRIDYEAKDGWGGIVWQDPPNDWGDRPGGWDLSACRRLTFWARGAQGGEVVSFEFGIFKKDKPFFDTVQGKLDKVALSAGWTKYTIDLPPGDRTRLKSGFVAVLAATGTPVTFYLDDIAYE